MWILEEMDINYKRFSRANRQIQDTLICCREICNEKKKQTVQSKLESFLNNTMPARASASIDALMPSISYSQASSGEKLMTLSL